MRYGILIHLLRRERFLRVFLSISCLIALLAPLPLLAAEPVPAVGTATLLNVNGAIGPAVADYLVRGLAESAKTGAVAVIIQLDTPGGLDHSMRMIIKAILASPVPVITYVGPDGARAASAGTFILYASHIAAMSPATNIGAASPVRIGAIPGGKDQTEDEQQEEPSNPPSLNTLDTKIFNDAAAYIKALAERHGRNAEWAVKAVRGAASLSAAEALELEVIDIIAPDITSLLEQADGLQVQLDSGPAVLSSAGLKVFLIKQSWRTRLLSIISDPNIAYILMLLGIYGLIYELANPGFILPGVVGGVSLLLALYAFQVLPVNYSGLALIVLGILLLVAEAYVPSFGSLGTGGIIAFAVGSIILMRDEELRVAIPVIAATVVFASSFVIWLASRLIMLRKKQVETGMEAMIGMAGEAAADFDKEGRIWVLGESWQAKGNCPVKKGEKVKITGADGHFLTIEKYLEVS